MKGLTGMHNPLTSYPDVADPMASVTAAADWCYTCGYMKGLTGMQGRRVCDRHQSLSSAVYTILLTLLLLLFLSLSPQIGATPAAT
jgi:hypothetical protein